MLKNFKQKGRVQHLPYLHLQTSWRKYIEISANTVPFMCCRLRLSELMKATVLAESSIYFIFSPGYLCSSKFYRHESGRCHALPFFLQFLSVHSQCLYIIHQALINAYVVHFSEHCLTVIYYTVSTTIGIRKGILIFMISVLLQFPFPYCKYCYRKTTLNF